MFLMVQSTRALQFQSITTSETVIQLGILATTLSLLAMSSVFFQLTVSKGSMMKGKWILVILFFMLISKMDLIRRFMKVEAISPKGSAIMETVCGSCNSMGVVRIVGTVRL